MQAERVKEANMGRAAWDDEVTPELKEKRKELRRKTQELNGEDVYFRYLQGSAKSVGFKPGAINEMNLAEVERALKEAILKERAQEASFRGCLNRDLEAARLIESEKKEELKSLIEGFADPSLSPWALDTIMVKVDTLSTELTNMHYYFKMNTLRTSPNFPGLSPEEVFELSNQAISLLKEYNLKALRTWVVAEALIRNTKASDLRDSTEIERHVYESCQNISEAEVLVRIDSSHVKLKLLRAFQLSSEKKLWKVPMAALGYFSGARFGEMMTLEGVSEAELETLTVLYGGAAYKTFEDALKAARELS